MVSGNTSVWAMPAFVAVFSATLPGIADACGVNPSKPEAPESDPLRRSPISNTPRTAIIRMEPCRTSAGRSTATAPTAAVDPAPEPRVW